MRKLSMKLNLDNATKKYKSGARREKSMVLEDICSFSGLKIDFRAPTRINLRIEPFLLT